jgi:signal transduction histidine kinase
MNGVKCTKEGQVAARFLRVDETTWAMQVADTGPGIPQEMWQDIFEPFRQVDGSDGHSARRGSGLGLAIVKQVTELMNGRVTVESEPGRGSVFTVTLPLILAGDENH